MREKEPASVLRKCFYLFQIYVFKCEELRQYIKLPDGEKAPLDDPYSFGFDPDVPYRGLTAKCDWA